jgi:hypothetical protein
LAIRWSIFELCSFLVAAMACWVKLINLTAHSNAEISDPFATQR